MTPTSYIDPASAVLVFVDLQEGLVDASRTNDVKSLRKSAGVMARVAASLSLPTFASVIPIGPTGAPPVISQIVEAFPAVTPYIRSSAGAFADPRLKEAIDLLHRPLVVIAGVVTEVAVLLTALQAIEAGYHVQVLVDACGGLSSRTEEAALRQIEHAGGLQTSVPSFIASLFKTFDAQEARNAMQFLQTLI